MKRLILLGLFISLSLSFVSAYQLDGLDIISREERGVPFPEFAKNNTGLINNSTNDNETGALSLRQQKLQIAEEYLVSKFPNEFKIDRIQRMIDGKEVLRPIRYNSNKHKIIIHHTADGSNLTNRSAVIKYLRDTYKYHAKTRKRGDIGYNFLVAPDGAIYEGRYGGSDAVGAHASYNNHDSVGISVMGNFENTDPTKEQLMSLAKLTTALVKKYNIDITKPTVYHQFVDSGPNYMLDRSLLPIIGHRDVGSTSCPGANLYSYFPFLYKMIGVQMGAIENGPAQTHWIESTKFYIPSLNWTQRIAYDKEIVKNSCYTSAGDIKIGGCESREGGISITLSKTTDAPINSYRQIFATRADGVIVSIWLYFDWVGNPQQLLATRVKNFLSKSKDPRVTSNIQKINYQFSLSELLDNRSKPIRVLLYDASTTLGTYQLVCRGVCLISGATFSDRSTGILYINPSVTGLTVSLNGKRDIAESIDLSSVNGYVAIANYARSSSSKNNPRNIFTGKLRIVSGPLKMIDGIISNKYQLINEVTLDQYMRGIAESNDSELQEKANSVYLLARMYAMYYLGQKNLHPSVPKGALYDLTDDPRIHQKYVGIGYDGLSKKWQIAHEMLSGHLILYNSTLPILPYFTCYPGFTWGAERFGWIDTPYLTSKLDLGQCATGTSQGHGAGLSGRGATMLARRGYSARQIIEFYFPGVIIKKY